MSINKETRIKVWEKYNHHCAYCGKEIEYKDMQVDHFIPKGIGVEDVEYFENYMPACRRCNHYKRANSLEGWRKMIEEIPLKLYRDSYIYKVGVDYGFYEQPEAQKVEFYFERFKFRGGERIMRIPTKKEMREKLEPFESTCLMTIEEFREDVKTGCIIDYDGCGYFIDDDGNEKEPTICEVEFIDEKIKEGYHYVLWFNK